jgi:hypothetical protein
MTLDEEMQRAYRAWQKCNDTQLSLFTQRSESQVCEWASYEEYLNEFWRAEVDSHWEAWYAEIENNQGYSPRA